jgi:hypothetical protein
MDSMRTPRAVSSAAAVAVVALVPLAGPGSVTANGPGRTPACPALGPATQAHSTQARVFKPTVFGAERRLVGCHRRSRRRTILDSWIACGCPAGMGPPAVWLSGRYVAVSRMLCAPSRPQECVSSLKVTDLRSRRRLHETYTSEGLSAPVLKPNGSLAYLNGDSLIRADRRGTRTIDQGPGIDPGSLTAHGNRLYWIKDQIRRVASFR